MSWDERFATGVIIFAVLYLLAHTLVFVLIR
jgi:hypothetical protein